MQPELLSTTIEVSTIEARDVSRMCHNRANMFALSRGRRSCPAWYVFCVLGQLLGASLPVDASDDIALPLEFVSWERRVSDNGRVDSSTCCLSSDQSQLLVSVSSDDKLIVYSRNKRTGELERLDEFRDRRAVILPGAICTGREPATWFVATTLGIVKVVWSSERRKIETKLVSGKRTPETVIAHGSVNSLLSVPDTGQLLVVNSLKDSFSILTQGPAEFSPSRIFQNTARGERDRAAPAKVDPPEGKFIYLSSLLVPRQIALSPDARTAYVTSFSGRSVSVFELDDNLCWNFLCTVAEVRDRGKLIGQVDGMSGADGICVSPDAKHVYVSGSAGSVVAFAVKADDRHLRFLEAYSEIRGNASGLSNPKDIKVTPDGDYVFVANLSGKSIAVFARNPTGTLKYQSRLAEGEGGNQGLAGVTSMVLSADGRNLYATASNSVVTVFRINK